MKLSKTVVGTYIDLVLSAFLMAAAVYDLMRGGHVFIFLAYPSVLHFEAYFLKRKFAERSQ